MKAILSDPRIDGEILEMSGDHIVMLGDDRRIKTAYFRMKNKPDKIICYGDYVTYYSAKTPSRISRAYEDSGFWLGFFAARSGYGESEWPGFDEKVAEFKSKLALDWAEGDN